MGLSEAQTHRVVEMLRTGFDICATVEVLYRADCFQQVYAGGAKLLSNNAGYWEAEVALARVGRNLYNFMRANTDKNAKKLRQDGMRLKAITPEALPAAVDIYRTNVERAEQLLRAGSTVELKYFEPIAELVEKHLGDIPK
ncbi:hypothetical protein [Shimia gijangensis]|nr:hypothetical protein [Shimia gijangensis]